MTTSSYEWTALVDGLNQYLRLRSIPIGMTYDPGWPRAAARGQGLRKRISPT